MKLQVTIDGKAYEVDVEVLEDEEGPPPTESSTPHRDSHAAGAHAQGHGGAWEEDEKICRSPVMGLVVKLNVQPGQAVAENQLLMVLEAMKMETNVTAPHTGRVKSVRVKPGDPVKLEQILIELE